MTESTYFFFSMLFNPNDLQGVDNIYAQHVPLIKDLVDQLLRGKLKDTSYPNVNAKEQINLLQQQQQQQQQQGQMNK